MPEVRAPSELPPAPAAADHPGLAGVVTLAGTVIVVTGLYLGRDVLIPITLAVLLSLLIAPLASLLRRVGLGRVPSVLVAVVGGLAVIVGFGGLIATQFADLAARAPQYETTVSTKLTELSGFVTAHLAGVAARLGMHLPLASATAHAGAKNTLPAPIAYLLQQTSLSPIQLVGRILGPVVSPLSTMLIVLIFSIFILLQREDLRDRLIRLFGSGDLHRTTLAMDDAIGRISRYFIAQLGINATFGTIVGVGLLLIGVPSPLLWGTLSMLLRFLPYIGSPLSSIGPLLLAAAIDPHWSKLIWTAVLFFTIEAITGQVVEPMTYGRSTGLSPFAVVVAATFWTWLWGPIGLLLSTPLTLCLVVLGRHVKQLEFLDILLGDRPALSPVESFYQRILAGDPDEALDHAEAMLKTCSLSHYYDEVVLKGLQLATNDALRGVLSGPQLGRVNGSIKDLVDELDRHEDVEPAPPAAAEPADERARAEVPEVAQGWRSDTAVLCIAGRGPLDEGAAAMLAQLLGKHALGARTVPFEAASRENIATLETSGVAMICLCYVDLTGSPAHLRYLLHRLHRRMPRVPIVVGFWPADDATLSEEPARTMIGADHYTSTLREAVEACVGTAGTLAAQTVAAA